MINHIFLFKITLHLLLPCTLKTLENLKKSWNAHFLPHTYKLHSYFLNYVVRYYLTAACEREGMKVIYRIVFITILGSFTFALESSKVNTG